MLKGKKDVRSPYFIEFCRRQEAENLLQGGIRPLFSSAEMLLFEDLKTDKRRKDWVSGRVAAKRALRRAVCEEQGVKLELAQIEVLNEDSGAPHCRLPGEIKPPHFSISHCSSGGLCGVAKAGGLIGVDWEMLALQSDRVFDYYAHASEQSAGRSSAEFQIRLWTAKEAVLKLLGAGLSFDLKDIRLPQGAAKVELHGRALRRWRQLGAPLIKLEHRLEVDSMITVAYA